MILLRDMALGDVPLVAGWLGRPHVARWWLAGTTAGEVLEEIDDVLRGAAGDSTRLLIASEPRGREVAPVGWCQWYRWDDDAAEAAAVDALPGECGIDYGIGEPDAVGRGLGTELIAKLVAEIRSDLPGCGIVVDPDAANHASRRVLEKNGFRLVAVRSVATERSDNPMAIYRLAGTGAGA